MEMVAALHIISNTQLIHSTSSYVEQMERINKKSQHLSEDRPAGRDCTASMYVHMYVHTYVHMYVQVRQAVVCLMRPKLEGGREACPTATQNLSLSAAATILRKH